MCSVLVELSVGKEKQNERARRWGEWSRTAAFTAAHLSGGEFIMETVSFGRASDKMTSELQVSPLCSPHPKEVVSLLSLSSLQVFLPSPSFTCSCYALEVS